MHCVDNTGFFTLDEVQQVARGVLEVLVSVDVLGTRCGVKPGLLQDHGVGSHALTLATRHPGKKRAGDGNRTRTISLED